MQRLLCTAEAAAREVVASRGPHSGVGGDASEGASWLRVPALVAGQVSLAWTQSARTSTYSAVEARGRKCHRHVWQRWPCGTFGPQQHRDLEILLTRLRAARVGVRISGSGLLRTVPRRPGVGRGGPVPGVACRSGGGVGLVFNCERVPDRWTLILTVPGAPEDAVAGLVCRHGVKLVNAVAYAGACCAVLVEAISQTRATGSRGTSSVPVRAATESAGHAGRRGRTQTRT